MQSLGLMLSRLLHCGPLICPELQKGSGECALRIDANEMHVLLQRQFEVPMSQNNCKLLKLEKDKSLMLYRCGRTADEH